ncbi:hypothetical protein GCM10027068_36630 [Prescottella soli]
MVVGQLDVEALPGVGVKRFLPYFSKATTAERVYHVFDDCPVGAQIPKGARAPGVGPGGELYQKCGLCQDWDDERDGERARRRAQCDLEWILGFQALMKHDSGQAKAVED